MSAEISLVNAHTGVVTYSLLASHVPLETMLIGANEHESQYLFDICYRNSTEIRPAVITGDMHSVNKVNFAILDWFGMRAAPRFTSCGPALHSSQQRCSTVEHLLLSQPNPLGDMLKPVRHAALIRN